MSSCIGCSVILFPPPPPPPLSLFHKTLRERVDKYFKDNNIVSLSPLDSLSFSFHIFCISPQDPKISYWMFLRYFVFFVTANLFWLGLVRGDREREKEREREGGGGGVCIILTSCYVQIVFHDIIILGVVMAAGWGLFAALVAMTCTHDARYILPPPPLPPPPPPSL